MRIFLTASVRSVSACVAEALFAEGGIDCFGDPMGAEPGRGICRRCGIRCGENPRNKLISTSWEGENKK